MQLQATGINDALAKRFEMTPSNRRCFPRETMDSVICVSLVAENFDSPQGEGDNFAATMVNQSDNGLMIEIDRYLEPGSNVRIKMSFATPAAQNTSIFVRDGRVMWCRRAEGANFKFAAGIKILRKVVQGNIRTSRFI
jgi:hypothetical protein